MRYVDASRESGDGSLAAPYPSLASALDAAPPSGTTLLLAAGTYVVDRAWRRGLSVRGRCAGLTSLVAQEGATRRAVIDAAEGEEGFALEDVTLGPAAVGGVALWGEGGLVTLRGVRITATTDRGLFVTHGAQADATDLVIDDTGAPGGPPNVDTQGLGRGLEVAGGAMLDARRVLLDRNRRQGAIVQGEGSRLTLEDATIANTRSRQHDGLFGEGVLASVGGRLVLRRTLLTRNRFRGLRVRSGSLDVPVGTAGTAEHLVVRGTELSEEWGISSDPYPLGIESIGPGASLSVEWSLIDRNRANGMGVATGAALSVADAVIRDVVPTAGAPFGNFGALVSGRGTLTFERVLTERHFNSGVLVEEEGRATLVDVAVREMLGRDGIAGHGIAVQSGGRLSLERGLIADCLDYGVSAITDGVAELRDLVVTGVRGRPPDEDGNFAGAGLVTGRGGALTLERGFLFANRGYGVATIDGSVTLGDVRVEDTRVVSGASRGGIGLHANAGFMGINGAVIEGSHETGLLLLSSATADLSDLVVRDTQGLQDGPLRLGTGIFLGGGARTDLRRALVEGNRSVGIVVVEERSNAAISDSIVRDTESESLNGRFGLGILTQDGGAAELARVLVAGSRGAGISADAGRLTLTDVAVVGTRDEACRPDCNEIIATSSLRARRRSTVNAMGFRLAGGPATTCGLQLGDGADVFLSSGVVEQHGLGVCLQSPGYPLRRLLDDVAYIDSGTPPVESTRFADPRPVDFLPPPPDPLP
ncbi:MAG: right-handed parallel beta-helix repeat-containing protein [Myxococcota bacterium]